MTPTVTATLVRMEQDCATDGCAELADRIHTQLNTPHYTRGVAVMAVSDSLEQWRDGHRTARKRADRAARLGYRFDVIDRSRFNDDIHDINTSLTHRQGRPMSDGYLTRHQHGKLPPQPCARHRVNTYGVLQDERLRAYMTLYRVGDLCLVSMILGHGDHLKNDIMYLLAQGMIAEQAGQGGVFYYNTWASGTDGLRYYKTRVGFTPQDIELGLN